MKNVTAEGQTLRECLETALTGSAADRGASGDASAAQASHERRTQETQGAQETQASSAAGGPVPAVVVGEVLDTHHPHLLGRVLVRWLDHQGALIDRWLQRERHLSLRKGDRVLLTLPAGWREWVVTGALGREAGAPTEDSENARDVRLAPGETLRFVSHEGQTLVTLRQGPDGPLLELGQGNVELSAARTLRLSADTIELVSASGGIDMRTDGDTVVRAHTIRLN